MRSFLAKLSTVGDGNLTSREEVLVDFIKTNSKDIVEFNIKIDELAKRAKTGFSAIYGLLKKIDIDGYRDFMICLANDVEHSELNFAQNDQCVSNAYINIIKQNHTVIKKNNLVATIELINKAPRIFVCYWEGVLKGPAMDLSNFFFEQGLNVYLLDSDWDSINERVNSSTKDDLFIFITKYGTSTHLARVIETIGGKKGNSIFISGKVPSKSIKDNALVKHTLIVDSVEFQNKKIYISKTLPFHYFNDLLIYHYLNTKK
ncbi:hypothetical protein EELLY_v1c00830 [Entomoplasma ellychniae]|uniref:HTH rpiR-type domain-containing protein n=1 Tax=Entomoplasma ellychniae TaxID=2114 RepID=A0A8E2QWW3_9MOLU|nr:MurR/RpiR family transcriptional regulator [Entomoplasma ellychniae]PPE04408.1 hypothetical protein EELLY_v1c00830 [Entomoplasma ellychniae]